MSTGETPKSQQKRNGETKDGSGNNNKNSKHLPQSVRNRFQIMKGGKGSGARRRNPENMTIKRFIEKSIDAMAFFFTASFAAIAVVATIVLIGCIL